MKNLLLPILAIAALPLIPTDAAAQISLYDTDGKVLFSSQETPAYLDFTTGASATQVNLYDADGHVTFSSTGTPAYLDFSYNAPAKGVENGHAWVDLGLPSGTLWATCNVGATNPEDYGDNYAWGETQTKTYYDWSTYFDTNDGGKTFQKYNNDGGLTELEASDDVASQTWGGKWQMPTQDMIAELSSQCYWVWTTTYNGKSVNGYIVYKAKTDADKGAKVTSGSSPSSDYDVATDPHLFLPAAGLRWGSGLNGAGSYGYYWSRSLDPSNSRYAYALGFYSDDVWDGRAFSRDNGLAVRPVVQPAAE